MSYSLFSEFIPKRVRTLALSAEQAFWSLGAVFGVLIAWLTLPNLGWRWFLGISAAPLLFNLVLYKFLPESPRYLQTIRKEKEAEKILDSVAKTNKKEKLNGVLYNDREDNTKKFFRHKIITFVSQKIKFIKMIKPINWRYK